MMLFTDGVDELSFTTNVIILLLMAVGFRVLAYLVLRRKGPKFAQV